MVHKIEIQNLKCGGCVNTVTTNIRSIVGVHSVFVDKDSCIVTVETSNDAALSAVKKKLYDLGYPEVGQENPIGRKAKSYLSCAVGKMK